MISHWISIQINPQQIALKQTKTPDHEPISSS